MVREIDALGGAMGLNTDACSIQMRMLNASKGPAVRAPRAQCDKKAYQFRMKRVCELQSGLEIHQGSVEELLLDSNGAVCAVRTSLGLTMHCRSVVLSAGTFMRGLMHVGKQQQNGGRLGDQTTGISRQLEQLGLRIGRFKTGTPARINGRSIDFSKCEEQPGDEPAPNFSYHKEDLAAEYGQLFTLNPWGRPDFEFKQALCWMTYTNQRTHDIIRQNLHLSPMYSGIIEGVGPRYCPSIEDKVMRFSEKPQHQVYLEPEGRDTLEYYINGISTSLPMEVQYAYIRSIAGLENAEIMRPGYAVEYDYVDPTQLNSALMVKSIGGLFLAGQINGTSGYEEAAAQGLMAGINAALYVQNKPSFVLDRASSYIGVMIDDLITKGVVEPYRMFTSRAEHRLLLRQDNADLRLTALAHEQLPGLVDEQQVTKAKQRQQALDEGIEQVGSLRHNGVNLAQWLRRPDASWQELPEELQKMFHVELWQTIEIEIKHAGHLQRQQRQVQRMQSWSHRSIPADIDFSTIPGLKREARERLSQIQPADLAQAGRIPGITPADVAILSIWLDKIRQKQ